MLVKCPRDGCNHEWDYKGKAWFITCPVCRKLFKNTARKQPVVAEQPKVEPHGTS